MRRQSSFQRMQWYAQCMRRNTEYNHQQWDNTVVSRGSQTVMKMTFVCRTFKYACLGNKSLYNVYIRFWKPSLV